MDCVNHSGVSATAYCQNCGKALCTACVRNAGNGQIFCEPCFVAWQSMQQPFVAPGAGGPNPSVAAVLGVIPGVGAIYNGQYAKGMVHAIVWGVLMSIADSRAAHGMEPVFVMSVVAWMAYMAFEAYHTARKRRMGEPVDEYSSLVNLRGRNEQIPVFAVALIIFGILLLLHTLDLLDFERVARFWPVLLIAAGVYLLYGRFTVRTELGSEEGRK